MAAAAACNMTDNCHEQQSEVVEKLQAANTICAWQATLLTLGTDDAGCRADWGMCLMEQGAGMSPCIACSLLSNTNSNFSGSRVIAQGSTCGPVPGAFHGGPVQGECIEAGGDVSQERPEVAPAGLVKRMVHLRPQVPPPLKCPLVVTVYSNTSSVFPPPTQTWQTAT